jgi:hypothetical protein
MSMPRSKIVYQSGTLEFSLEGALDESDFDLQPWEHYPQTRLCRIQLFGVDSITSRGVRRFVEFRKIASEGRMVEFYGLPICFVDVWNQIPDVVGDSKVLSLFAPYFCTRCQMESSELLVLNDHAGELLQGKAPTLHHSLCGGLLDFDSLEESYFMSVLNLLKKR